MTPGIPAHGTAAHDRESCRPIAAYCTPVLLCAAAPYGGTRHLDLSFRTLAVYLQVITQKPAAGVSRPSTHSAASRNEGFSIFFQGGLNRPQTGLLIARSMQRAKTATPS